MSYFLFPFFSSSFYLLLFSASLNWATLSVVSYIPKLELGFLMEVSSFNNLTFFLFIISMRSFFVSLIGMTVLFLTASYSSAWIIMLLSDFCVLFSRRTTILSSILGTCNSIGATWWRDILFIYSILAPEYTWMEAAHAWVFVVKLGGLRIFFVY